VDGLQSRQRRRDHGHPGRVFRRGGGGTALFALGTALFLSGTRSAARGGWLLGYRVLLGLVLLSSLAGLALSLHAR
jgi:hypothetical protein